MTTSPTVAVHRDVAFDETPERTLLLDAYEPVRERRRDDAIPLFVTVHGGGWREGSRGQLARYALDAAEHGYVAVDVEHRLSTEAGFPAAVRDCKAALAWAREHAGDYGADPDRVVLFGHSSGAHLVALVATTGAAAFAPEGYGNDDHRVDAVVGASGLYDLTVFDGTADMLGRFLGGNRADHPERYRDASPVHWVDEGTPSTLLLHGTNDAAVDHAQSERFHEALADAGVDVQFERAPGGDHVFLHSSAWYHFVRATVFGFVDRAFAGD